MKIVSGPYRTVLHHPVVQLMAERMKEGHEMLAELIEQVAAGMPQGDLVMRLSNIQERLDLDIPDHLLTDQSSYR